MNPILLNRKIKREINLIHQSGAIECNKESFVVVCLVKNGEEYIDEFVSHYKQLGCNHIVFIDNDSCDNTVDLIKKYNDVSIFFTSLSFKEYENEIRRSVINSIGINYWCLCVDIDEFFDFPYSKKISMAKLIEYLNINKYTAVVGQLLDMFPKGEILNNNGKIESLKNEYRYYDISGITKTDYYLILNKITNPNIKIHTIGIRNRFSDNEHPYLLSKHPLIFIDGHTLPIIDPHYSNCVRVADISCVLLHYKFTPDFFIRLNRIVKKSSYPKAGQIEHNIYHSFVTENPDFKFFSTTANEYLNVNDLLKDDFIIVTDSYRKFVNSSILDNVKVTS